LEVEEGEILKELIARALSAKDTENTDLRRLLFAEQKARSEDYAAVNQLKSERIALKSRAEKAEAQLSEARKAALEAFNRGWMKAAERISIYIRSLSQGEA
jgi:hypothetical protein